MYVATYFIWLSGWPPRNLHFNCIYLSALLMWNDWGTAWWRDAKFPIALGGKSVPFICFKKDIVRKRQNPSGLLSRDIRQFSAVTHSIIHSIILLVLILKKFSLILTVDLLSTALTLNTPNDDDPSFDSSLVIYLILRVRT